MTEQTIFHEGQLTVSQVMSEKPSTVEMGTTLFEVARILGEGAFRHVLVEDSDGRIVGVVSSADLLRAMSDKDNAEEENWLEKPVESVMTSRFVASTPDADAEDAARVVAKSSMRCVPVIEGNRLVGVLTADDFLMSWNRVDSVLKEATTDPITGLANRTIFDRRLAEEWDRASRQGDPLGVVLFDVDYFKQINDLCGHPAGDSVLYMVGACLKRHLRVYDVVARHGGDEFAAICFGCQQNDIIAPIARIQQAIRNLNVPTEMGRRAITLSIGAAVIESPYDGMTAEKLIEAADHCLYAAKRNGRDCAFRGKLAAAAKLVPIRIESEGVLETV